MRKKVPVESLPLTWDELADIFDKLHPGGRRARTRPMEDLVDWAEARPDLFFLDEEGYITLVVQR